jgi:hypothetical protein
MKTNSVFFLIVFALMGFFLFISPVAAETSNNPNKETFNGYYCRLSVTTGNITYVDNRKKETDGEAWFKIWNCHEGIDGVMNVFDKKYNREVLEYGPPRDVLGSGIATGNLILIPDKDVGGGYYEGKWQQIFKDGFNFVRIDGKGFGGTIDGYILKAHFQYEIEGGPNCGAPFFAEIDFSGFLINPYR